MSIVFLFVKETDILFHISGSSDEEIQQAEKAVNILGGKIEKTDKFLLPETDMGRALVNIKKIKSTPAKYREGGILQRAVITSAYKGCA